MVKMRKGRLWQVAARISAPLLCVFIATLAQAESEFVVPKILEPNVAFWKRVYSEWSTDQIALTDEEDLSMIYKVIDVPADTGTSARKKRSEKIKKAKEEIREALSHLDALQPRSELEVTGLARELFIALKDVKRDDRFRRMDFIRGQNGLKNRFEEGLYLSGAHEQEIRLRLKQAGMPEELIAVVFVESLFHSRATSHAGAGGIWQFMKGTAREFMRVNTLVDERFDPILATDAAIQYMKSARASLVEWPLVITSYNYGRNGMMRAVNMVGSRDIADILANYDGGRFGFAARNYYAEFLAALAVYQNAKEYFPMVHPKDPWEYDIVKLEAPAFLKDLTKKDDAMSTSIHNLNPALMTAVRNGKEVLPSGFVLRVPKDGRERIVASLQKRAKEQTLRAENLVRVRHRANGRQTLAQIARLYDVFADRLGLEAKIKPKRGTILSIRSADSCFTPLPEPLYRPMSAPEVSSRALYRGSVFAKNGR